MFVTVNGCVTALPPKAAEAETADGATWIAGPPGLTATGMCCTGRLGSLGVNVTWPWVYWPEVNWSPLTVTVKVLVPPVGISRLAGATDAAPAGKPLMLNA